MLELTTPIVQALDVKRRLFQPAGQRLLLLAHKPAGQGGYELIIEVASGWRFAGRTGQPGKLSIAETGDTTLDNLQKARAFAIDGLVYQLEDDQSVERPKTDAMLVWNFTVTPTGEPFADGAEESGASS